MDLPPPSALDHHVARELAACLAEVADRLDSAIDLNAFLTAVEAHRRVWLAVRSAAPELGHLIPPQLLEISLSSGSGCDRLDDHRVETLIHIDRFVSVAIAKACAA